jgi:hypothetical protein
MELIRNEFFKHTLNEIEPNMTAHDWEHQLELAIALLKQLIAKGTDFEGNSFNERQEKDLHGLLKRCSVQLDIIKKELEQS